MNSRKRTIHDKQGRLLDVNQLCGYLNMGKNRAVRFAEECGAKRKFGKSARYDRTVIDAALNRMIQTDTSMNGGDDDGSTTNDETETGI